MLLLTLNRARVVPGNKGLVQCAYEVWWAKPYAGKVRGVAQLNPEGQVEFDMSANAQSRPEEYRNLAGFLMVSKSY